MATTRAAASPLPKLPASSSSGSTMARSRLHNFVFPTAGWGAGRTLRCRKDVDNPVSLVVGGETAAALESAGSLEESQEVNAELELPWNLRRRRAFSKGECSKSVAAGGGEGASARKEEKRKVSVALSLKEIEADFLLMNGKKPHRRPKKRPRHVQKQVDAVFPCRWLSEVTPDMYKVVE